MKDKPDFVYIVDEGALYATKYADPKILKRLEYERIKQGVDPILTQEKGSVSSFDYSGDVPAIERGM